MRNTTFNVASPPAGKSRNREAPAASVPISITADPTLTRTSAAICWLVYGPGGKYNTMPDERVELRDLFNAARVYARVIVETCA